MTAHTHIGGAGGRLRQQQIVALDQAIPWLERYRAVLRELREART